MDEDIHKRIDELELKMKQFPEVECPTSDVFTPGLYARAILMKAGLLITSKIHKTEHPFFVLQGVAHVKINDGEWKKIETPYIGVTLPGTRRILYIESDCIWVTCHANPEDENVEQIEARIIESRENPLLTGIKIEKLCLGQQ